MNFTLGNSFSAFGKTLKIVEISTEGHNTILKLRDKENATKLFSLKVNEDGYPVEKLLKIN